MGVLEENVDGENEDRFSITPPHRTFQFRSKRLDLPTGMQPLFHRTSKSPQIDVRFSTTGILDAFTSVYIDVLPVF